MALALAITGGSGFVGGHGIQVALRRGHIVRALARRPQPAIAGVEWITGDLADEAALAQLVAGTDAVIHIAGVTNAADRAGYAATNIDATALLATVAAGRPFVHVSSLAARAPMLSLYGWSKRQGEEMALAAAGPVVALRPPAVYGPGDREFPKLLQAARFGLLPMPKDSFAAMLYGPDLGEALVALAEDLAGPGQSRGLVLEIDDGAGGYRPAQLAAAIGAALGRPVRAIEIPPLLLRTAARAGAAWATLGGRVASLSPDRARYMAHPDWSADSAPLLALGLWKPMVGLADGMKRTVDCCRQLGILP